MNNVIEDISKLTTIPQNALDKLVAKANWCIADSFNESIIAKQQVTEVDIGIGTLLISNLSEEIQYKFIPHKELEDALISIAVDRKNPIQLILEKKLVGKIINTYKTII